MSLMRSILRQTATTAVTTLVIQMTTFVVLASAPLILSGKDFAQLSLIVATTMLSSAVFDLGLNLTATKFFGDSAEDGVFRDAFRIRLLCLPVAIGLWGLSLIGMLPAAVGLGSVCGASLNIWNGIRSTDQARQDYLSFSRASLAFALLRLFAGMAALFVLGTPIAIAIGLYILPVAASVASKSWVYVRGAFRHPMRAPGEMLGYAFYVYINALAFIGLPYIPQFLVNARFDAVAVGTYGLIMTFIAPVSLLIYSLRAVLLPKMLGRGNGVEQFIWSAKGFSTVVATALMVAAFGLIIASLLDLVYGARFPEIRGGFAVFFAGFSITTVIGVYSLSVHTLGVPKLAMWAALIKVAVMFALLNLHGTSLQEVIFITSAVMVAGEILMVALLYRARERQSS